MTDDSDLAGFDPYDAFDREADRLYRFLTNLDEAGWSRPSGCRGWTVRDLLGHLRSDEDYFTACLDGRVGEFMGDMGARGATDLTTANQLGVDTYASTPTGALIEAWRAKNAETRRRFRERDGGDVDSSAGTYPARWQAFHLAQELATHADDMGVPVEPGEEPARTNWRCAVSRFALKEVKPGARADAAGDGTTRVVVGDVEATLPDTDFVQAVASRLPAGTSVGDAVRAALAITP